MTGNCGQHRLDGNAPLLLYQTVARDLPGTPPISTDLPPSRTVFLDEPDTHILVPPTSKAVPPSRPQTLPNCFPNRCPCCSPCHDMVLRCLPLTSPSPTLSVTSCTTSTRHSLHSPSAEETSVPPAVASKWWSLQEAGDHASHVTDQFHTYTEGNDLAILLKRRHI